MPDHQRPGLDNTAIIVTTFLRDDLLRRCVESIRKFYPDLPVFVGDNGHETEAKKAFLKDNGCHYFHLDFDLGVSGVRNATLKQIPDVFDYLYIVEDDCIFTEKTDIAKLRSVLDAAPNVGLCGQTLLLQSGKEQHYEAHVDWHDGVHFIRRVDNPCWEQTPSGVKFYTCDLILNVFLMRRQVWLDNPWDEQFKTALEHCDFFMGLQRKTKWKVAYTPDSQLCHWPESPGDYQKYRGRPVGWTLFGQKWGLKYVVSDYNAEAPLSYEAMGEGRVADPKGDLLKAAVAVLNANNLTWWAEAGTCLGAVRENGFIPHDPDIDIGLHPKHLAQWEDIKAAFVQAGFTHYKDWMWKGQPAEVSFYKDGVKLDLFFFRDGGELWWHGAFGPDKNGEWGDDAVFLPHSFPAHLFQNLEMVKINEIPVYTPNPPKQYLAQRYGPRWPFRNRAYRYWVDCRAIDKAVLKRGKKSVFVPGTWDLLTAAHIDLLERAKRIGTSVVLGVYTDEAIASAIPRREPPVMPFADRLRIAKSLALADSVMPLNHIDPTADLEAAKLTPAYIAQTDESDICPGEKYVRDNGGKAVFFPALPGYGDEMIRNRIIGAPAGRRPPAVRKDRVAVVIKTFLRDEVMMRTVAAVKKMMPFDYRLYIADDGTASDRKTEFYARLKDEGHVIIDLPYNSGISLGRNAAVRIVNEDYILLLDDDTCVATPESLRNMKAVLDEDESVGIVSALLKREGGAWFGPKTYSEGLRLDLKDGLLKRTPMGGTMRKAGEVSYRYAHQVPNVFLAKREVFRDMKWDDRIRVEYEHMDFFLTLMATPWKAAVCFDAEAIHFISEPSSEYNQARRSAPSAYFYQKHGIGNISNQF